MLEFKISILNPAKVNSIYHELKKKKVPITEVPKAKGILRNMQLGAVKLLKEIDYICKKNGLEYLIVRGSVLGAYRHQGFIPWDDDLDICLWRNDYEKLYKIFNKETRNKDLYIDFSGDSLGNLFLKVRHKKIPQIFIDIYPYDFYGDLSKKEKNELHKLRMMIRKRIIKHTEGISYKNKYKLIKFEILTNRIIQPDNENKKIIATGYDSQNQRYKKFNTDTCILDYDMIYPFRKMKFEDMEVNVPNKTEEYLTNFYGDFMQYPKKVVGHHTDITLIPEENKKALEEFINS